MDPRAERRSDLREKKAPVCEKNVYLSIKKPTASRGFDWVANISLFHSRDIALLDALLKCSNEYNSYYVLFSPGSAKGRMLVILLS